MRAALVEQHGPPDVVSVRDVSSPPVGPGEARVEVHAAAVNFPDVLIVADRYQLSVPPPFTPGSELAGVITEVGADVDLPVGTRVFGTALVGAFAEEIVLPATSLTRTPDTVDHDTAAAFGVAHRTAYHSLRSIAALQAGEELIVLGAGGGVGLAAVQLGRALGATVTAVASTTDKLAVAEAHGASHLVEHRGTDLRAALKAALPDGADVVIDPVGGTLAEPALRTLRHGGRFVTVGYASGDIPKIALNLVLLKGCQIVGFEFLSFMTNRPADAARDEAELLDLLAAGTARPHIGQRFALDEVAGALHYVADGKAIGKVVLQVRAPT